jgi:hypothetical protein
VLSRTIVRGLWPFLAANAITVASVNVQGTDDEQASYGNMCGPMSDQDCNEPLLKAGFPFAYLADSPATSVHHQLGIEDDFRPLSYAADVGFYMALIVVVIALARLQRTPRKHS